MIFWYFSQERAATNLRTGRQVRTARPGVARSPCFSLYIYARFRLRTNSIHHLKTLDYGRTTGQQPAVDAHAEQETGKSIAHYDLRFLKPLDESMLHEIGKRFKQVVTVEDGVLKGGMGSAILEFMADNEYNPQIKRIGLPDQFVQHGSVKELYHICGMDEEGIYKVLISF